MLLACLFALAAWADALASSIPPQCVCTIRARVLACTLDTGAGEGGKAFAGRAFAAMTVEVLAVEATVTPHYDGKTTCAEQHPVGKVLAASAWLPQGDPMLSLPGALEPGAVIRGDAELLGGAETGMDDQVEYFSNYELRNLKPATP